MRGFVLTVAFLTLILVSCVFTQSPDGYVRNSKTMPNFLDKKSGWLHDPAEDQINGGYIVEFHENKKEGLIVLIYIHASASNNESKPGYVAEYGSNDVGRAAIKIDGRWYVGRAPFYDNGKEMPENRFKGQNVFGSNGNLIGIKITLETVDGLKELVIPIP